MGKNKIAWQLTTLMVAAMVSMSAVVPSVCPSPEWFIGSVARWIGGLGVRWIGASGDRWLALGPR